MNFEETMMSRENGQWGWLGLGVYVASWNLLGGETLSHSFARGMEHPVGRLALVGGITYISAHLLDLIPPEYDPLDRLHRYIYD